MCNITAFVDNMVMMESIWTLATLSAFRAISVLDPFKVKQVESKDLKMFA